MNNDLLLELDIKLAEALGYTNVKPSQFYFSSIRGKCPVDGQGTMIDRWSVSNSACFELLCKYEVNLSFFDTTTINSYIDNNPQGCLCSLEDFESREQAVRCSIINSVIWKLEGL